MDIFGERWFNLILLTIFIRGNKFAETQFYINIETIDKLTI